MSKPILYVLCFLLLTPLAASAQVVDGLPGDSTIIRFTADTMQNYIADTSATPLWQIGHSGKVFFGVDSTGPTTIMTDTIHQYPVNANNWFVIKVWHWTNTIIDFWHKYQTDTGHAGGIVEFSLDQGVTWQNVKGDCNADSSFLGHGVRTTNFYTFNDTLNTGEPSFTGVQDTVQYSRFQFYDGPADRTTNGSDCTFDNDTFYIRFRFVSDSTTDSLAGWIIDSIKVENDEYCCGGVAKVVKAQTLDVYPNPSDDGLFIFPALANGQHYRMGVYNAMGEKILNMPYQQSIDLGGYAKGLYFYKVSDGMVYYSGRLLTE